MAFIRCHLCQNVYFCLKLSFSDKNNPSWPPPFCLFTAHARKAEIFWEFDILKLSTWCIHRNLFEKWKSFSHLLIKNLSAIPLIRMLTSSEKKFSLSIPIFIFVFLWPCHAFYQDGGYIVWGSVTRQHCLLFILKVKTINFKVDIFYLP